MRLECPVAGCKGITHRDSGRKYLPGVYRDKRPSALIDLRSRLCKACGHAFLIRIEYPLDRILEPTLEISYNWAEYNNALKVKPGPPQGGTTVSDYTQMIHHDTQSVWWRVLGYDKHPDMSKNKKQRTA